MRLLYTPPKIISTIFNKFIWESSVNKVLLTFDDGPHPETTPLILNLLKERGIKALHFCVGESIKNYPHLFEEMLSCGQVIGNHTMTHKDMRKFTGSDFQNEVVNFNDYVKNEFDYTVKYFRPPFGRFKFNLNSKLCKIEMKNVMWSLLTFDYKNDIKIVKFALANYLRENSIIVLHDSLKSKDIIKETINFILEETNKRCIEIGNPTECLK